MREATLHFLEPWALAEVQWPDLLHEPRKGAGKLMQARKEAITAQGLHEWASFCGSGKTKPSTKPAGYKEHPTHMVLPAEAASSLCSEILGSGPSHCTGTRALSHSLAAIA